jgi:hypothetical protein
LIVSGLELSARIRCALRKAARARLAPLWNCECSNPEGVEMGLAQDGA